MIRLAAIADTAAIAGIYNHYIFNAIVTFEEETVSTEDMAGRITEFTDTLPWLVEEEGGRILGYA